ncbi:MAG TPA: hypothetical protein VNR87_10485 [Flavisolibacter sp.]|nr:hypothetical protein [Flavisolibacter sp.]
MKHSLKYRAYGTEIAMCCEDIGIFSVSSILQLIVEKTVNKNLFSTP